MRLPRRDRGAGPAAALDTAARAGERSGEPAGEYAGEYAGERTRQRAANTGQHAGHRVAHCAGAGAETASRSPARPGGNWARRVGRVWSVALGVGLVLAAPLAASGRERTQVALSIDSCVAVEPAQVRHLLSLELGGPLCEGEIPAGATRAAVTCHRLSDPAASAALPPAPAPTPAAGYLVELRVDDAVTGKSLWRSIELQPTDPGVRARLLSLALAELLFASWAELLVTPQPAVPAAAPTASAADRQATSVQVERKLPRPVPLLGVQLSALGAVHMQLGEPAVALGGGVRLTGDHRHHLGWDVDVLLHHGESATALGTVTRDLVSARATLLLHHQLPYLTLRAGLGGRFGAARLAGEATDPRVVLGSALWGPWGGPLLAVGVAAAATRVRLDLSFEAGYVIAPVAARVGGVRAVAVEGTWFGIQLGLGGLLR